MRIINAVFSLEGMHHFLQGVNQFVDVFLAEDDWWFDLQDIVVDSVSADQNSSLACLCYYCSSFFTVVLLPFSCLDNLDALEQTDASDVTYAWEYHEFLDSLPQVESRFQCIFL